MSARIANALRRQSKTAILKTACHSSEVLVNLRTGAVLTSKVPALEYDGVPTAKPSRKLAQMHAEQPSPQIFSPPATSATLTLEESLWRIEQSLATGQLKATEAVMSGVRMMRKQVAREEEMLLQEYA